MQEEVCNISALNITESSVEDLEIVNLGSGSGQQVQAVCLGKVATCQVHT